MAKKKIVEHHRSSPYEPDPNAVPAKPAKVKTGTKTVPMKDPAKKAPAKKAPAKKKAAAKKK